MRKLKVKKRWVCPVCDEEYFARGAAGHLKLAHGISSNHFANDNANLVNNYIGEGRCKNCGGDVHFVEYLEGESEQDGHDHHVTVRCSDCEAAYNWVLPRKIFKYYGF
ncbi:MAG: hypothetical protein IIA45_10850 [Bacteroidetes bacterium]|nr:hypothetical protein [Bacteroidota bacterium]